MAFTLAELLGRVPPRVVPPPPVERPRCAVTGKACFPDKAEALAVARQVNAGELHCNRTYRCDFCFQIHLGRRSRRG